MYKSLLPRSELDTVKKLNKNTEISISIDGWKCSWHFDSAKAANLVCNYF